MTVYLITNTVNGKMYVGKTSYSMDRRWKNHVWAANRGSRRHLASAIRKYGVDSFTMRIIAHASTPSELSELEIKYIKEFKTFPARLGYGYNMTAGGEGTIGAQHSEATRRKISDSNKGNRSSAGRIWSQKSREKARAAMMGKKNALGTKCPQSFHNRSMANKGRKVSDATRAKLRAINLGKRHSEEVREIISQRTREGYERKRSAKTLGIGLAFGAALGFAAHK